MPRHQAYQPHAGKALKVAASVFLFLQHSSPFDPKQDDGDHSITNVEIRIRIFLSPMGMLKPLYRER